MLLYLEYSRGMKEITPNKSVINFHYELPCLVLCVRNFEKLMGNKIERCTFHILVAKVEI